MESRGAGVGILTDGSAIAIFAWRYADSTRAFVVIASYMKCGMRVACICAASKRQRSLGSTSQRETRAAALHADALDARDTVPLR